MTTHSYIILSLFYSSSFFSIIPLPPLSTLFPYTTLFRSSSAPTPPAPPEVQSSRGARRPRRRLRRRTCLLRVDPPRKPRANRDRKSTRLNSSHVAISYAVFCLKKKKQK